VLWLAVVAVGVLSVLFFGVAIWQEWMSGNLAVFLSSLVSSAVLALRWTVLRRYVGRSSKRRASD
jgi:hypothetical protein